MNDELQTAVSKMMNETIEGMDKATGFLSGEIPLYIQELLVWKAAYSGVAMLFGLFLIVLAILKWPDWFLKTEAWVSQGEIYEDRAMVWMSIVFLGIVWWVFVIAAVNLTWLQIWLAPRVFLVEYAASLAK